MNQQQNTRLQLIFIYIAQIKKRKWNKENSKTNKHNRQFNTKICKEKKNTNTEKIRQQWILETNVFSCKCPSSQIWIKNRKPLESPHHWIIQPVKNNSKTLKNQTFPSLTVKEPIFTEKSSIKQTEKRNPEKKRQPNEHKLRGHVIANSDKGYPKGSRSNKIDKGISIMDCSGVKKIGNCLCKCSNGHNHHLSWYSSHMAPSCCPLHRSSHLFLDLFAVAAGLRWLWFLCSK